LQEVLELDAEDVEEGSSLPELMHRNVSIRTFDEEMVLTLDKGLVVRVDGERFFLTVQKG